MAISRRDSSRSTVPNQTISVNAVVTHNPYWKMRPSLVRHNLPSVPARTVLSSRKSVSITKGS
jgi:hypothetical protein